MTAKLRRPLVWAISLALVVVTAGNSRAQTSREGQGAPPAGTGSGMMADRQKMMAEMKAAQRKLDDLVAAMNTATGNEKMDRIAAVVRELVAQHRSMTARMMSGGMMMQMPTPPPAPPAVAPTPESKGTSDEDHAAHHPKP